MKQKLLEQVGLTTRLRVLDELKRTPSGLVVRDLADRLKMSYMGVKDVCLDLEKKGLVDTWRDPGKSGRPRLLYRVTEKAHELFPTASNSFTLEVLAAAQKLFGPSGSDKLLLVAFQQRAVEYERRVRGGSLEERARSFARIRDTEGHMAQFEEGDDGQGRISEYHSPILDVLNSFPIVAKLESEMFERVLGVPVRREELMASGQFCVHFHLGVPRPATTV